MNEELKEKAINLRKRTEAIRSKFEKLESITFDNETDELRKLWEMVLDHEERIKKLEERQ